MPLLQKKLIELSKIDFVNKAMNAEQVYNNYKPAAFINACLYDVATSTNITKVEDENKSHGYLFSDWGIGVHLDNTLEWVTFNKAQNDKDIRDFIAGSPTLVEYGVAKLDWGNKVSTQIQGKKYRSAIGFNSDTLFLYTSDSKMTLEELAKYMQKIGCRWAINLDGGGSCHLQEGEKIYTKSTRKNASWFLIYCEKEVKKMKATLRIGDKTIDINGNKKEYDVAPFIKNNRTFVPVRFLEDLGFQVTWIASEKKIEIIREE